LAELQIAWIERIPNREFLMLNLGSLIIEFHKGLRTLFAKAPTT
jgi:hypothetical protein